MAKQHKKAKRTHRRRHRMSGFSLSNMGGGDITSKAIGAAAGSFAGQMLPTFGLDPKYAGLIKAGIGVLAPSLIKGNKIVEKTGDALFYLGVNEALHGFGVLKGLGCDDLDGIGDDDLDGLFGDEELDGDETLTGDDTLGEEEEM